MFVVAKCGVAAFILIQIFLGHFFYCYHQLNQMTESLTLFCLLNIYIWTISSTLNYHYYVFMSPFQHAMEHREFIHQPSYVHKYIYNIIYAIIVVRVKSANKQCKPFHLLIQFIFLVHKHTRNRHCACRFQFVIIHYVVIWFCFCKEISVAF